MVLNLILLAAFCCWSMFIDFDFLPYNGCHLHSCWLLSLNRDYCFIGRRPLGSDLLLNLGCPISFSRMKTLSPLTFAAFAFVLLVMIFDKLGLLQLNYSLVAFNPHLNSFIRVLTSCLLWCPPRILHCPSKIIRVQNQNLGLLAELCRLYST